MDEKATVGSHPRTWFTSIFLLGCIYASSAFYVTPTKTMTRHRKPKRVTSSLQASNGIPSLVVFDLDNTCWTPELYQLRKLARENGTPVAGKDVELFDGSKQIIEDIKNGKYPETKFAVASRTKSVDWAHHLITQFGIRDLLVEGGVQIFPGNKEKHFANLKDATGIEYEDMLFFDDARDGKYGNCEPVAKLGALSVHCPNGLYDYEAVWKAGLRGYQEWAEKGKKSGSIVEWDGTLNIPGASSGANSSRTFGMIKTIKYDKGFGFLTPGGGGKDVFFHFSDLPPAIDGDSLKQGDKLSFVMQRDGRTGKMRAADIEAEGGSNSANTGATSDDVDSVTIRTFSMNLPFAALLANGHKTLESRNGTMFTTYPSGTVMMLHVGQRTYPDGGKHLEILRHQLMEQDSSMSDDEVDDQIQKLKSLPKGFSKGSIVAICEIGDTHELSTEERSTTDVQRKIVAYGPDSGKRVTEIVKVAYLKQPIKFKAQGGVFSGTIPHSALPDGLDWVDAAVSLDGSKGSENDSDKKRVVYSISG